MLNTGCGCDTKSNSFNKVFPFATEAVSEYLSSLDLKDTSLLTVGSSCDQAFNALVLGVKNITIFDINPYVYEYYKIKRNLILNNSREDLYRKVLEVSSIPFSKDLHEISSVVNMNNYLQSDENYELLCERLKDDCIDFVQGDIFNIGSLLDNRNYDRIVLSNILQYLEFFAGSNDCYKFLREKFDSWKEHLSDEGIMQLLYLYDFSVEDVRCNNHALCTYNLKNVVNALKGNSLSIEWIPTFDNSNVDDAIVTYTKKR